MKDSFSCAQANELLKGKQIDYVIMRNDYFELVTTSGMVFTISDFGKSVAEIKVPRGKKNSPHGKPGHKCIPHGSGCNMSI